MKIRFQNNHPAGNLLFHGLRLTARNWPCLLCTYAVWLTGGLLAGIPFYSRLAASLNHCLTSRQLPENLNAAHLRDLAVFLRHPQFFPIHAAGTTALCFTLFGAALLLLLVAGTIHIYLTAEPPRLPILLKRGIKYFWRFLRIALPFALIAGSILAALIAARAFLLEEASKAGSGRTVLLYAVLSAASIVLAALLLRLWLDLVELYAVQNGMRGNRRVRQTLMPALRLLLRHFLSIFPTFFLAGLLGAGFFAVCLFLWKDLVPAHRIWLASVVSGLGLFFLLAARFWQRGMQAVLLLAVEPPQASSATHEEPQPKNLPLEPTLQDLVRKLQNEPWAIPDRAPAYDAALLPQAPSTGKRSPQDSLLAEHSKKVPLLDPTAEEEPAQTPQEKEPPSSGSA